VRISEAAFRAKCDDLATSYGPGEAGKLGVAGSSPVARFRKTPHGAGFSSFTGGARPYEQAVAAYEGRALVGAPPTARAFTLRVGNKIDLRRDLSQGFGYSARLLFPDFPGFRDYWEGRI
jgi:hypothetical protein